jgi:hypothetical protein
VNEQLRIADVVGRRLSEAVTGVWPEAMSGGLDGEAAAFRRVDADGAGDWVETRIW